MGIRNHFEIPVNVTRRSSENNRIVNNESWRFKNGGDFKLEDRVIYFVSVLELNLVLAKIGDLDV